ncbi:hypothetical protein ONZ51_g9200 [Trametes cubensis]|uniref:G domain-containing protein n=1 Tax=Trametes cubensis TaxID=1111947 RepID=A0AAD7TPA9_9APHY|nr:hypothetical protein ONZ51_g9200 [Trametes cubensis]
MGVGRPVDEDPLSRLLAPPPNETAEEREIRLRLEAEARMRSERIDDQLRAEKAALKKNRPVKVLLLGQSESGKSTTLKTASIVPEPPNFLAIVKSELTMASSIPPSTRNRDDCVLAFIPVIVCKGLPTAGFSSMEDTMHDALLVMIDEYASPSPWLFGRNHARVPRPQIQATLTYCQDQWEAERASWRMVIQLNLVRGINSILDLLAEEMAGGPTPTGNIAC